MITVNDLKNGLTFKYKNAIYLVLEFQHVKPGKGSAFVRTKLRNLNTGAVQDITFSNTSEKIEKAHIDKKEMQYLYQENDDFYFMDLTTYEQLAVNKQLLDNVLPFLIANMNATIIMYEATIIGVTIPEKMSFEVIEADPSVKGDTRGGGDKMATIETGFKLRVPLFIEVGEKIIVNTVTKNYVSREK